MLLPLGVALIKLPMDKKIENLGTTSNLTTMNYKKNNTSNGDTPCSAAASMRDTTLAHGNRQDDHDEEAELSVHDVLFGRGKLPLGVFSLVLFFSLMVVFLWSEIRLMAKETVMPRETTIVLRSMILDSRTISAPDL